MNLLNIIKLTISVGIFYLMSSVFSYSIEVKIIMKLNNEIITNLDIEEEIKYLTVLNNDLKKIKKDSLISIAKNTLINDKIKKNELLNYILLDQQEDPNVQEAYREIYNNLGFKNKNEFDTYLKNYNLNSNKILNKLQIEVFWNQLIFSKFNSQVKIDRDKIKKDIFENPKKTTKFELSEIVFEFKDKNEIEKRYEQIINSIKKDGFDKTVLSFSVSNTNKKLGYLGWIDEKSISSLILNQIKNLNIGDLTKPIIISNKVILIKLIDKKKEESKYNIEEEIENIFSAEFNNQLKNLSEIYFNKLKNSYKINEY